LHVYIAHRRKTSNALNVYQYSANSSLDCEVMRFQIAEIKKI